LQNNFSPCTLYESKFNINNRAEALHYLMFGFFGQALINNVSLD